MGAHWGNIGVILGLYGDNGKENGNYNMILRYIFGYIVQTFEGCESRVLAPCCQGQLTSVLLGKAACQKIRLASCMISSAPSYGWL